MGRVEDQSFRILPVRYNWFLYPMVAWPYTPIASAIRTGVGRQRGQARIRQVEKARYRQVGDARQYGLAPALIIVAAAEGLEGKIIAEILVVFQDQIAVDNGKIIRSLRHGADIRRTWGAFDIVPVRPKDPGVAKAFLLPGLGAGIREITAEPEFGAGAGKRTYSSRSHCRRTGSRLAYCRSRRR